MTTLQSIKQTISQNKPFVPGTSNLIPAQFDSGSGMRETNKIDWEPAAM